jgi:acyl carrier protein
MELQELFSRFEIEFEIDLPDDAEETLRCVRDVRDCVRRIYREQGIEAPAGAIFERLRRLIAVLARVDASEIEPQTHFADLLADHAHRAA